MGRKPRFRTDGGVRGNVTETKVKVKKNRGICKPSPILGERRLPVPNWDKNRSFDGRAGAGLGAT